jgi:hypothetical protein
MLCLWVSLLPMATQASTPLDPDGDASLTLYYQKDGKTFPDLQVDIYRVAEAFPDGTFQLIAPFSSYPVNIHDIMQQSQWKQVASTLDSYIVANQVAPDRSILTDEAGVAKFEDLTTGLYMVCGAVAENGDGVYIFDRFMVYVPTPNPDGTFHYHVEAKPKCTEFIPKNQYSVTKLWQDAGNQQNRPQEVTVNIYKDGVLQETQVLSAENNWTYTWSVTGSDQSIWTVAEASVPNGYKVNLQQSGGVFTLINTWDNDPPEPPSPPKTGDTFAPLPWFFGMCFSGMMLLILGIYGRRRR